MYILYILLSSYFFFFPGITFQNFMTLLQQNTAVHTHINILFGPEYNLMFED